MMCLVQAPESIHPKTKLFSKASDVWAFGVVIWELLTDGEDPFANMESIEAGMAILMGERLEIRESWPSALQSLMSDCWATDLNERPLFEEIYKRLEAALNQHQDD